MTPTVAAPHADTMHGFSFARSEHGSGLTPSSVQREYTRFALYRAELLSEAFHGHHLTRNT